MLKVRAANPDVIINTGYPAPAVLITQKYAEFEMTKTPIVVAVQGIPLPAVFAKNVGNDAALANLYYGSPLNDLTDGPKQQRWIQLYKQYYPDRTAGAFMTYGLPSAMAVTMALEKAGKGVTRESFIDALESIEFDSGVARGTDRLRQGSSRRAPRLGLHQVRREDAQADAGRLFLERQGRHVSAARADRPKYRPCLRSEARMLPLVLQAVASGVVTGCVYALIALSLVIVYKSTDVINFAGGEVVMIGGYLGMLALLYLELPYPLIFVFGALATFVLGASFDRVVLHTVLGRAQPGQSILVALVIATVGLSYVLKGGVRVIPYTEEVRRLPPLFTGKPIFLDSGDSAAPRHRHRRDRGGDHGWHFGCFSRLPSPARRCGRPARTRARPRLPACRCARCAWRCGALRRRFRRSPASSSRPSC